MALWVSVGRYKKGVTATLNKCEAWISVSMVLDLEIFDRRSLASTILNFLRSGAAVGRSWQARESIVQNETPRVSGKISW